MGTLCSTSLPARVSETQGAYVLRDTQQVHGSGVQVVVRRGDHVEHIHHLQERGWGSTKQRRRRRRVAAAAVSGFEPWRGGDRVGRWSSRVGVRTSPTSSMSYTFTTSHPSSSEISSGSDSNAKPPSTAITSPPPSSMSFSSASSSSASCACACRRRRTLPPPRVAPPAACAAPKASRRVPMRREGVGGRHSPVVPLHAPRVGVKERLATVASLPDCARVARAAALASAPLAHDTAPLCSVVAGVRGRIGSERLQQLSQRVLWAAGALRGVHSQLHVATCTARLAPTSCPFACRGT